MKKTVIFTVLLFFVSCQFDRTYCGLVQRVSADHFVLTTVSGTYDLDGQCAAFAGYIVTVKGCVDGDTVYGNFLDVHYITDVQK
jgi:hypothetical protein